MSRKTDTRTKAIAAARELSGLGVNPTVAAIREKIGGGSPNTIVSALRQWRGDTAEGASPEGTPPASASQVAALYEQLLLVLKETRVLSEELAAARARSDQDRRWFEEQLALTQTRYSAVQTYMLRAIDDARQTATDFKEKYTQATQELSTWRAVMTDKNSRLQAELDVLRNQKGRVEG